MRFNELNEDNYLMFAIKHYDNPQSLTQDDFYEDLTEETATKIFEGIKNDKIPKPGSQKGRVGFEPNKRLTLVKN